MTLSANDLNTLSPILRKDDADAFVYWMREALLSDWAGPGDDDDEDPRSTDDFIESVRDEVILQGAWMCYEQGRARGHFTYPSTTLVKKALEAGRKDMAYRMLWGSEKIAEGVWVQAAQDKDRDVSDLAVRYIQNQALFSSALTFFRSSVSVSRKANFLRDFLGRLDQDHPISDTARDIFLMSDKKPHLPMERALFDAFFEHDWVARDALGGLLHSMRKDPRNHQVLIKSPYVFDALVRYGDERLFGIMAELVERLGVDISAYPKLHQVVQAKISQKSLTNTLNQEIDAGRGAARVSKL